MSPPSGREFVRPPSRRDLLRACGVGFATLAGCIGSHDSTESSNATTATLTTTGQATTTKPTAKRTTTEPRPVGCGTVSFPDEDWPLPDRDPTNANYAPSATGPRGEPSVRWRQTADPVNGDGRVETGFGQPVVSEQKVFVAKQAHPGPEQQMPAENYVHAYDLETGEFVWSYPTETDQPRSVAVADSAAFAHTWGDVVHALGRDSGTHRWTFDPDGVIAGVTPVGRGLYVGTGGTVVALDFGGSVAWTTALDERVTTPPAVRGQTVFVGTEGGSLVAFRGDDGRRVWSADLDDDLDEYGETDDIVLTECTVVASVGRTLYAIDRDGSVRWATEGGYSSFATDGETLFTGTGDGWVRSLDLADGGLRWERYLGKDDPHLVDGIVAIALTNNTAYVSARPDALYAFDPGDGTVRWKTTTEIEEGPGSPTIVDDAIFMSGGKHLVALD